MSIVNYKYPCKKKKKGVFINLQQLIEIQKYNMQDFYKA